MTETLPDKPLLSEYLNPLGAFSYLDRIPREHGYRVDTIDRITHWQNLGRIALINLLEIQSSSHLNDFISNLNQ